MARYEKKTLFWGNYCKRAAKKKMLASQAYESAYGRPEAPC